MVSVVKDLGLPIKFIGVGEKIDDLREFDPTQFVDALLGNDAGTAQQLKEKANKMMSVVSESGGDLGGQVASPTSGSASDASSRLAASFQKSATSEVEGSLSTSGSLQIPANPGESSSKRKKRPKPQQSSKKKKKSSK